MMERERPTSLFSKDIGSLWDPGESSYGFPFLPKSEFQRTGSGTFDTFDDSCLDPKESSHGFPVLPKSEFQDDGCLDSIYAGASPETEDELSCQSTRDSGEHTPDSVASEVPMRMNCATNRMITLLSPIRAARQWRLEAPSLHANRNASRMRLGPSAGSNRAWCGRRAKLARERGLGSSAREPLRTLVPLYL